jgi:DNA ligase (NAD+)
MTQHLREIEARLVHYNIEYRKGTPIVSDQVFDALLEQFEREAPMEDYNRVRLSLFGKPGKIRHQFLIGSLRKTKAEDDSVTKWFKKDHAEKIMIVEKIDGMSMVLTYVDGNLVMAASRGDGTYGSDYTEKVKHIQGISKKGNYTGQIRTELLIKKSVLQEVNDLGHTYKNPRNAVVGIAGSDTYDIDLLKRCSILAYQIMGDNRKKGFQYVDLKEMGFDIPKSTFLYVKNDHVTPDSLKALYEKWTAESDYEIDGLVIHNTAHTDEDTKLPKHTIAFKVNDLVATTTLDGVEWTMSREKKFKPVGLIAPIQLGGATIRRVTMNNAQWMIDRNLTIGSTVTIEKAGDIIPKIIDVIPNLNGKIDLPLECPHCKATPVQKGVDIVCDNDNCTGHMVKQLNAFLRNLEVDGFSERSLELMKIKSIKDLLNFYPDGSHNQDKFMSELFGKVFSRTKIELIIALPFNGFGKRGVAKVMKAYGKSSVLHNYVPVQGMSTGRQTEFKRQFKELIKWKELITHDNRWKPQTPKRVVSSPVSNKLSGMSFCFTGKMETLTRSEAELYAKSNGAEVKSVSNKLTYLVTNNPNSGTSKNKKAQNLGVQLITEKQFCELIGRKYETTKKDAPSTDGQVFDITSL